MLDSQILKAITRQIQARFPEMINCRPKVRPQTTPKSVKKAGRSETLRYLITYRSHATLSSDKQIERWVRVIVNKRGKIIKITTSR